MSVNLMSTVLDANGKQNHDKASADWARVLQVSQKAHSNVALSDETVTKVASLIEGTRLSNGEKVFTYVCEGGEYSQGSFVASFGPNLLGEDTFRAVRTALEEDDNGEQAVAMFDLITEIGIRTGFSGKDYYDAHMSVENWPADTVEINTTEGHMSMIFITLGLDGYNEENHSEHVPLEIFEKAVNDNDIVTDMTERLQSFVQCAKRRGSTHVYWA